MSKPITASGVINADGLTMTLETGKLANLVSSVHAKIEGTELLSTAATAKAREGTDFFPLTVDVEERMYAAGKIPGSFFRREGRPSEHAILTSRLTDRPLRPAFADDFKNEVQLVSTILGVDLVNPHDILSINACSAALYISGMPFEGPVGATRLAHLDGKWVANPTYQQGDESTFELVVAGRELENGDVAIMMVEAGATPGAFEKIAQGAPKITEEVLIEGLDESKKWISAAIKVQRDFRAAVIAEKGEIANIEYTPIVDYSDEEFDAVKSSVYEDTSAAMLIADKHDRQLRLDVIKEELIEKLCGSEEDQKEYFGSEKALKAAFSYLQKKIVRTRIIEEGIRIDGRKLDELRPVSAEVGVLAQAHGSALFQRGETQVLSVATLGMPRMEQMLDTITVDDKKTYMHHYNFPPSSVGEVGRVGSPKRREIGHGALAERALIGVIPDQIKWPYTMRVVSDVLASNGSTSQASVCGSTLALMDAGVPIAAPIAGIAMGLITDNEKYVTLTDILGAEDAFGDMDFKVAGSRDSITALQLDTKIDGIPADVLGKALSQAKQARLDILDVMEAAISAPREDVKTTAPKIITFEIPGDKIGEVIGPKGKNIQAVQAETGCDISINDVDGVGVVTIGGLESSMVNQAKEMIDLALNPPVPEVGAVYEGTVVGTTKFGAFVNILPGRDGLVHISKLGNGKRVDVVEDVINVGDVLQVRVEDMDDKGKVALTPVGDGNISEASSENTDAQTSTSNDEEPRTRSRSRSNASSSDSERDFASFSDFLDTEMKNQFGDLGPEEVRKPRDNNRRGRRR
ncbi:MAG: polyribonucleotide nucleotidyltransferase [Acidimicrobiia bacterium]